VENNSVAEAATIVLPSPSPVIGDQSKKEVDVIDICDCEAGTGSDRSPEHE
jgi:flap endonuclease GEN